MIRVITYASLDRYYDCDRVIELRNAHIDYENKTINYDGDFEHDFLCFFDIVKIEKQVKDCTFIELEQYVKTQYKGELFHVGRLSGSNKIEIEIEYNNYLDFEYLDLDDYIDITELIKEK